MISRLEIQNYKALKNVALDLTPIHVLIGPNDSGKTSILEALQILSAVTSNGRKENPILGREPRELYSFGQDSNAIEFSLHLYDHDKSSPIWNLSLSSSGNDWSTTGRLKISSTQEYSIPFAREICAPSAKPFLESFEIASAEPPISAINWDTIRSLAHSTTKHLQASLYGIQIYRWIPRHLALPVGLNADRKFRMDESGFGLPTLLDDILSSDRRRFDELERRFQEIFPEVESLSTPTQKGYASAPSNGTETPGVDGKGLEFKFKHIEKPLSAGSVSDGYLIILAYLALLHTPQPPPMLLIEEPENGIHPKRLAEIVRMLRSLTEREGGPQILLTTHSPYLLDEFKPEEVTLCTKGEDGTVTTRRVSESETVKSESGVFSLGEIWSGEDAESLFPSSAKTGTGE